MPSEDANINKRLDSLRDRIFSNADFIIKSRTGNESNFMIFSYDPEDEAAVEYFIDDILKSEFETYVNPKVCNLYDTFISICEDLGILDSILEYEKENGSESLLDLIHEAVGVDDFVEKMSYSPHGDKDIVIISGVGDVYPFIRVHVLLEAMQAKFSDVPVLVFYPGGFSGYQLKLYNRLPTNDYYRAIKFI